MKDPRKGNLSRLFSPISTPYNYAKKQLGKHLGYHIAMQGWENDEPMSGSSKYDDLKDVFKKHGGKRLLLAPLMPTIWTEFVTDVAKALHKNKSNALIPKYQYDEDTTDPDNFVPDNKLKRRLMESSSLETSRSTFRTAMKLIGMYWTKSGPKEFAIATGLAATTLIMSKLTVDTSVDLSYWNRDFINVLTGMNENSQALRTALIEQLYGTDPSLYPDKEVIDRAIGEQIIDDEATQAAMAQFNTKLLTEFPIMVGKYLVTAITAFTSAQHLALRWRTWITGKITNEWLKHKAAYKLRHGYTNIDNPDQRIQEDLDAITDFTVSITTEGMQNALTLGAFLPILWAMGSFNPAFVGGPDIEIPGFMTWAAVTYAAVGTGILGAIAYKLPGIRRRKQATEGTFRAGLMSNDQQSEQISLANGEGQEKALLKEQFGGKDGTTGVVGVSREYINKRKQMITFNSVHANFGSLVPYIAGIPQLASSIINYGQLSQAAQVFRNVENSFSFFMNNITAFAATKANVDRLGQLVDGIELARYEKLEKDYYAKQKKDNGGAAPAPAV
jgi:ABC-type uncharacterized transport system fused permease/ATPase subunit